MASEIHELLAQIPEKEIFKLLLEMQHNKITPTIEIAQLFDEKIIRMRAQRRKDTSIKNCRLFLNNFLEFCLVKGIVYLDEIKDIHVDEFKVLLDEKYKPASAATRYNYVKIAFNLAIERKYIVTNPFRKWAVQPVEEVTDEWTLEYWGKLVETIDKRTHKRFVKNNLRDKVLVSLLFWTGIRVGKILAIKRKDVDITGEYPLFTTSKKLRSDSTGIRTHSSVVVHDLTRKWFIEYIDQKDLEGIGMDEDIFDLGYVAFKRFLSRLCRRACIEYKSAHKAKHGFISHCLKNGISDGLIMKATGNTDPKIFQRYKHAKIKDVANILERIQND